MKQMSDNAYFFAKQSFKNYVEEILDDPFAFSESIHLLIEDARKLAKDFELDFDVLIQELGTEYEVERLLTLEGEIE